MDLADVIPSIEALIEALLEEQLDVLASSVYDFLNVDPKDFRVAVEVLLRFSVQSSKDFPLDLPAAR